mmetsp:Transcript_44145/g.104488  ORF Transcript_44145/g.104488 Transcript_44145/m.104488 type:complete len:88 (-) Transcript_44145:914-1177(-)
MWTLVANFAKPCESSMRTSIAQSALYLHIAVLARVALPTEALQLAMRAPLAEPAIMPQASVLTVAALFAGVSKLAMRTTIAYQAGRM